MIRAAPKLTLSMEGLLHLMGTVGRTTVAPMLRSGHVHLHICICRCGREVPPVIARLGG